MFARTRTRGNAFENQPVESDPDPDPDPIHTSAVGIRTQRVRNECGIPSKRRAMCCCLSFWMLVGLILGGVVFMVSGSRQEEIENADALYQRFDSLQKCTKLGPDRCKIAHASGVHKRDTQCPPGHTWNAINVGNIWTSKQRGMCVRRHFYPRVFDASFSNPEVPVCTDVYTHACGQWDEWFGEDGDVHRILSFDPIHHHTNILPILEMSLQDKESMLYKFVRQRCRPIVMTVPTVVRDASDDWIEMQANSQLPVWIPSLQTHSVCALAMLNSLIPSWFYELSLGYTSTKAHSLATKIAQLAAQFAECKNITAWFGALGDPLVVQVEWNAPAPMEHTKLHSLLGKNYGNAWTVASAFAPFTTLVIGEGRRIQVRMALPKDRDEWMQQSHCERIASVIYTETLEDRYTALTKQQQPEIVLSAMNLCTQLNPQINVMLMERSAATRSDVWKCIDERRISNWHSLARVVANCNSGHRIQPTQEFSDAFVPRISVETVDPTHVQVWITAGLLQVPWFSSEMELQSIASRLYWIILRSVADHVIGSGPTCHTETLRDQWTLDSMTTCFKPLMDTQFWLELIQLQCGQPCSERWEKIVQNNQMFRHAHKCGSNQVKDN